MVLRVSNGVHLEVLEDTPTELTGVHLEVYDKAALATMVADITDAAEDVKFTAPLGPDSMLIFRIHRDHPKAVYIERGNLVKARYNGIYVNPSWLITGDPTVELAEHPADETIDVACISAFEYLDEFVLRNEEISPSQLGDPWAQLEDGRWFWDPPQPPAAIVVRQFEEAQTAGYLPALTYDFDRSVDSQNNPWPEKVAFDENVGAGFAGVVRKLMALGFEAQMRHDLLFQAFVEYGRHFEDSVVFGPGNIYRRERPAHTSKLRSRMLVRGKGNLIIEVVDPAIEAQIGHPVIGSMHFDSDDPTTLDRVGKAALRQLAEERDALTLPVRRGSGPGQPEPFIDYRQGDWIGHHRDGSVAPESRRIVAITITQANGTAEPEVELELDAIVLTSDQRRARQIQVLSGSLGVSGAQPSLGAAYPPSGVTQQALDDHAAAANPHPSYATDADLATHAAAPDPHPGYTTPAEVVTAIAAAESAHEGEADPHPGYTTAAELAAAEAAHEAEADPHTQYQKESEKGTASGYAGLDAGAKVPLTHLDEVVGLDDLTDVTLAGQADGDFLKRESGVWVPATSPGGAVDLDDLSDVDLTTDPPADEEVLTFEASTGLWVPKPAAGGGGGGAPTGAKYITAAGDGTLSAEIVIPGLAASPDIAAGGGSDDEFDTTSAGVPTGWTASANAPTAQDTNTTHKSHYYIEAPSNAADKFFGIHKAAPSIPYTVTTKITDNDLRGNYGGALLAIGDASDLNGKAAFIMLQWETSPRLSSLGWTTFVPSGGGNASGFSLIVGNSDKDVVAPIYLRAIVTAANNVTYQYSRNGLIWITLVANNAYLAAATRVFIGVNPLLQATKATFDWVRFS